MSITETPEQMVKRVFEETAHARTPITLYRRNDPAYSLFRVNATNWLGSITAKHAKGSALAEEEQKFLQVWLQQPEGGIGDRIQFFIGELEAITGRPVQIQ
jgi:hypothetical protein